MKNSSLMYSDILKSLKTIEEAKEFSSSIDTLLSSLFKSYKKPFLESLENQVSLKTAQILKKALKDKNVNPNDNVAIENFLMSLKNEVEKLKVLKLYLAFSPTAEIIENIFDWVLKNIGEGIILDIEKDEEILGGAIIVLNGKYQDLTVRKQLEDIFKKKKGTKAFSLVNTQN